MMDDGYQLLKIRQESEVTIAVLPLTNVTGQAVSESLDEEFLHLIEFASGSVVLDLRQVEFIDGCFITRILQLHKGLKKRSLHLHIQLSPSLAKTVKLLRLDQLLDIAEST